MNTEQQPTSPAAASNTTNGLQSNSAPNETQSSTSTTINPNNTDTVVFLPQPSIAPQPASTQTQSPAPAPAPAPALTPTTVPVHPTSVHQTQTQAVTSQQTTVPPRPAGNAPRPIGSQNLQPVKTPAVTPGQPRASVILPTTFRNLTGYWLIESALPLQISYTKKEKLGLWKWSYK